MTTRGHKTKDALVILDRITGDDAEMRECIEEATFNAQVAELIYATRQSASLTQKQLAALVGSTQPAIARLENADYEGHSLTMLRKIGEALNLRLELRFVSMETMSDVEEQPVGSRPKNASGTTAPRRSARVLSCAVDIPPEIKGKRSPKKR